jgi:hypothetical protein
MIGDGVIVPEVVQAPPSAADLARTYQEADISTSKTRVGVLGALSAASLLYGLIARRPAPMWGGGLGLVGAYIELRGLTAKEAIRDAANAQGTSAVGQSHLSPADLARVQAENRALNAASEQRQHTLQLVGGLAVAGALGWFMARRSS